MDVYTSIKWLVSDLTVRATMEFRAALDEMKILSAVMSVPDA